MSKLPKTPSVYEQYPHGAECYERLSLAGYEVGIGRGGQLYTKGKGGVRDKKVYAQYAEALRDDAFLIEQIKGYIRGVKKVRKGAKGDSDESDDGR